MCDFEWILAFLKRYKIAKFGSRNFNCTFFRIYLTIREHFFLNKFDKISYDINTKNSYKKMHSIGEN